VITLGLRFCKTQLNLNELETIEPIIKKVIQDFGKIDMIINNAGIGFRGSVAGTDLEVHQKLMRVNYFAQLIVTKGE